MRGSIQPTPIPLGDHDSNDEVNPFFNEETTINDSNNNNPTAPETTVPTESVFANAQHGNNSIDAPINDDSDVTTASIQPQQQSTNNANVSGNGNTNPQATPLSQNRRQNRINKNRQPERRTSGKIVKICRKMYKSLKDKDGETKSSAQCLFLLCLFSTLMLGCFIYYRCCVRIGDIDHSFSRVRFAEKMVQVEDFLFNNEEYRQIFIASERRKSNKSTSNTQQQTQFLSKMDVKMQKQFFEYIDRLNSGREKKFVSKENNYEFLSEEKSISGQKTGANEKNAVEPVTNPSERVLKLMLESVARHAGGAQFNNCEFFHFHWFRPKDWREELEKDCAKSIVKRGGESNDEEGATGICSWIGGIFGGSKDQKGNSSTNSEKDTKESKTRKTSLDNITNKPHILLFHTFEHRRFPESNYQACKTVLTDVYGKNKKWSNILAEDNANTTTPLSTDGKIAPYQMCDYVRNAMYTTAGSWKADSFNFAGFKSAQVQKDRCSNKHYPGPMTAKTDFARHGMLYSSSTDTLYYFENYGDYLRAYAELVKRGSLEMSDRGESNKESESWYYWTLRKLFGENEAEISSYYPSMLLNGLYWQNIEMGEKVRQEYLEQDEIDFLEL